MFSRLFTALLIVLSALGGAGGVVGEWAYDAYGEPIFAAHPHPHAVLKCGHKGLFFDRLDAGVYDPATGGEMDRLVPDARGLYYARNRHHRPERGRRGGPSRRTFQISSRGMMSLGG